MSESTNNDTVFSQMSSDDSDKSEVAIARNYATETAIRLLSEEIPNKIKGLRELFDAYNQMMEDLPVTKKTKFDSSFSPNYSFYDTIASETFTIARMLRTILLSLALHQPPMLQATSFECGVEEEFSGKISAALVTCNFILEGDTREPYNTMERNYKKKYSDSEDYENALFYQGRLDEFCQGKLLKELSDFLVRLEQIFIVNADSLSFLTKTKKQTKQQAKARIRDSLVPIVIRSPSMEHKRSNLRSSGDFLLDKKSSGNR